MILTAVCGKAKETKGGSGGVPWILIRPEVVGAVPTAMPGRFG
jgi:hypothetical protein